MDPYQETFKSWNKVARIYQDKFMNLDIYNASYDLICQSIHKANPQLLEIGCGPGNMTKYLLKQRPDFNLLGLDVAPGMIELAKNNNPTARFSVMDARNINELKQPFDGILCGFCLPYLSSTDSDKLIIDCYKLLNNQGLLYLSFVEGSPDKSGYQTGSSGDKMYFYYHDLFALKTQLVNIGFKDIRVMKVNYQKTTIEKELHTILLSTK